MIHRIRRLDQRANEWSVRYEKKLWKDVAIHQRLVSSEEFARCVEVVRVLNSMIDALCWMWRQIAFVLEEKCWCRFECEKSLVCWRTGWSPCRDVLSKIFYGETSVFNGFSLLAKWNVKIFHLRINWSSSFCLCVAWRIVVGCLICSSNGREIVHFPLETSIPSERNGLFIQLVGVFLCCFKKIVADQRQKRKWPDDKRCSSRENGATRSTTGKSVVRWCWERRIFSIF